jgi:hypothetical protein
MITKTDFSALAGEIDSASGIIRGVSVITAGEARGHGLLVDAKTLQQVKDAAETYPGGLKVKTDHYSGFNEIVGTLKNFTIDGDQLRADLFLLKNHDATARILEMAELMPGSFGLSISFSGQHEEQEGYEEAFARCSEIYSADLVDAPAANPTGLFSAKVDSDKMVMDEKQIADAIAAALAPVIEDMAAMQAKLAALEVDEKKEMSEEDPLLEPADKEEEMSEDEEKEDMSAKLAAELAEIKSLVTNFGAKPVAVAVPVEAKTEEVKEPTNFSEALEVVKAEGLSGAAATKAVIARFPDLYLAARNSGIKTL